MRSARKKWIAISRILKSEGADPKCMAKFYMAVIQAVLLYGADSWVVKSGDLRKLRSFHARAARYMTGMHIRKRGDGRWEYPDQEKVLEECGLFPMKIYYEIHNN